METFTFTTVCGTLTLTVKNQMVKELGDIHKRYDVYPLFASYNIQKYLHNPSGPAIINNISGNIEYWLNGKLVDETTAKKLQHAADFHNRLTDIIGS